MIAVFIRDQKEFDMTFRNSTPNLFLWIKSVNDIRGREFIGVVQAQGWWHIDNKQMLHDMEYALDVLQERQPILFKKNK